FAVAVIYLLKDKVKTEAFAIWAAIFGLAVFASISRASILTAGSYRASTFLTSNGKAMSVPLRVTLPWVGPIFIVAGLLFLGMLVTFGLYLAKNDERARAWGHRFLKLSFVVQACGIAALVGQVKTLTNIVSRIDPSQYMWFGKWIYEQEGLKPDQIAQIPPAQIYQAAADFVAQRGAALSLSLKANPVEFSALITALVVTFFVIFFSFRTERLREALPSLEKLDSLMYKTASVTFALLAMLLITGAVWANESWGSYWSWDSKEVGALVAWFTYAAYLHTRIARGWTGRRSAYFAIVGFLLILFTYLGVSYLLPGLHSYA
ncbi:MAG TPA: cytochrome c biogenesis protein CcsA, partial [Pyrinomonadaceae bacterium]|nr:cytochrome c biogenesis protein CcsA [Pyrinomonadaceae bacterium]